MCYQWSVKRTLSVECWRRLNRRILCVSARGKFFCLYCSGSIACFKVIKYCVTLQFKVQRKVEHYVIVLITGKWQLCKGLELQQISSEHSPGMAVHISGKLCCWFVGQRKTSFVGKLILKCLQHTEQEICLEKEPVFNTISVSGATVTLQVESDWLI